MTSSPDRCTVLSLFSHTVGDCIICIFLKTDPNTNRIRSRTQSTHFLSFAHRTSSIIRHLLHYGYYCCNYYYSSSSYNNNNTNSSSSSRNATYCQQDCVAAHWNGARQECIEWRHGHFTRCPQSSRSSTTGSRLYIGRNQCTTVSYYCYYLVLLWNEEMEWTDTNARNAVI